MHTIYFSETFEGKLHMSGLLATTYFSVHLWTSSTLSYVTTGQLLTLRKLTLMTKLYLICHPYSNFVFDRIIFFIEIYFP